MFLDDIVKVGVIPDRCGSRAHRILRLSIAFLGKKARMIAVLLAAGMLQACANIGPPVLERAVLGYDETDSQLSQQLLLLNIARWQAGEPPHLTVTSSIAATFDWTATYNVGRRIDTSNDPGSFWDFNLGGRASENPTFSILPLQGQDYVKRLLEPFTEDLLSVASFDADVALDRLLRLVADGIEVYGPEGGFQRLIANSPRQPEEYIEFRRIVLHLHSLFQKRQLFIRPLIFEDILFTDLAVPPRPQDITPGLKEGVTWRQKPDGRFQASKLTQGRLAITNYDPLILNDEQRRALNDRIKRSPVSLVYLEIAAGHPGGDFPLKGAIRLRSFANIIKFIAEGMGDVPEFDVEPDSRTGSSVAFENQATTLRIEVTETAPPAHLPSVQYRGQYYSVADTDWDRGNFRILALLNQASIGDVKPVGLPITIAK